MIPHFVTAPLFFYINRINVFFVEDKYKIKFGGKQGEIKIRFRHWGSQCWLGNN